MSWIRQYLEQVQSQPRVVKVIVQEREIHIEPMSGYDAIQRLVSLARHVLSDVRLGGDYESFVELSDEAIASAVVISELVWEPKISVEEALILARDGGIFFAELLEACDAAGTV